jgi:ATP-binding cassette subfamily B (MDR/TAP) protein 1
VQEALDVASKARTTICIAHRLSTIKNADNIIVISRGEIVEQGTHTDLIALGGVYKGLVEAQRISSEKKDGIEKAFAEADEEMEELAKAKSLEGASDADGLFLTKTKTGRSVASVEAEKFTSAGLDLTTKYSNFQLLKKVSTAAF